MSTAFRLIATDLDGTLLRSDDTISDRTRGVLQMATAAGMIVVLVSARPPRSVRWVADRLQIGGLAICTNGALTYDLTKDVVVRRNALSTSVALDIARRLGAEDSRFSFATEHGHKIGYEPGFPPKANYTHLHEPRIAPLADLCTEEICKLFVHHPDLPIDALMTRVGRHAGDKAAVSHSGDIFVELCAAGISKASALAQLCDDLGIGRHEVVAFGDMPNDLPMLDFAGHAVAVSNAHHDVIAAADEIARSNDEDGLALVIERLLGRDRSNARSAEPAL